MYPQLFGRENIASDASVGAQLLRAARAGQLQEGSNRFNTCHLRKTVELLSQGGEVASMAYMDHTFGSGMELHGIKLFPSEVAVHIIRVDDMSHWTGEVVGEKLGLCMDMTIRWN